MTPDEILDELEELEHSLRRPGSMSAGTCEECGSRRTFSDRLGYLKLDRCEGCTTQTIRLFQREWEDLTASEEGAAIDALDMRQER